MPRGREVRSGGKKLAGRESVLLSWRRKDSGWGGRNGCTAAFVPTVFLLGSKFPTALSSPLTPAVTWLFYSISFQTTIAVATNLVC